MGLIDCTDINSTEIAKIHKKQRRNKEIRTLWFEIQDVVGPAKEWPVFMRQLFWSKVKHDMRPIVAAFVIVNGLNPKVPTLLYSRGDTGVPSGVPVRCRGVPGVPGVSPGLPSFHL